MRLNIQQAVRAIIILLFALYIINLHYTRDILKLINPKYNTISQIGVIILLILFTVQLQRIWSTKSEQAHECCSDHEHNHDHGDKSMNIRKLISYSIIVLPIVTGFILPPSTLDASIASKKGVMLSITNNALDNERTEVEGDADLKNLPENSASTPESEQNIKPEETPPTSDNQPDPNLDSNTMTEEEYNEIASNLETEPSIEMNDTVYSAYYEAISANVEEYVGKEITLNGFVYKEDNFEENQFVLARYLITHCVADSTIIGFLSNLDDVTLIMEDTWMEISGTIYIEDYNGVQLPAIKVKEWKEIQEPPQPYLYPISVLIE
ncbi:TIGR03943 family protein [Aquibacillus koreensis]|uniref:TIGR03943 family protein n=1 Tax=Aquibacillus koreensis TaxID=279446 RepID=A0A9X3WRE0_9BACI|nr:TIGR03943 family protein [Aquibacillus koreensis]MCT2536915.1 TIGR03943 family protein [Aquibacillus koreensis]MDC3421954.1 TIGR03943 family protein [Aquibacillus koreensis]